MNLFVAKLSPSTTSDDLEKIFSAFGEVTSAKIIIDRETQNSKGYGFVEMPNDEEAEKAIAELNETELDGKQIVVKQANPQGGGGGRPARNFNQRGGGFQNRGGGGGGFQRRDDRRSGGGGGGGRRFDNRNRGGGSGGYDQNERW